MTLHVVKAQQRRECSTDDAIPGGVAATASISAGPPGVGNWFATGLAHPLLPRVAAWLALLLSLMFVGRLGERLVIDGIGRMLRLPDAQTLRVILEKPMVTVERTPNGSFVTRCRCFLFDRRREIPQRLRDAIVAAEDQRFYVHSGIDWVGIARAVVIDIYSRKIVEGGSTLTQQLAKNVVGSDRSLERKIREFIIAKRIESLFTKEQILDLYLNRVYFGQGTWGVENAARRYFGKHAKDLSLYQAAMLAGIVQAPSKDNPESHPQAARRRAEYVLRQMVSAGSLTEKQAARAVATASRRGWLRPADLAVGDYMAWIARQMPGLDPIFGKVGTKWHVVVSLDTRRQLSAELAIDRSRDQAFAHNAREAALIAMDVNGNVAALIGGRNPHGGFFDRATEAKRQPGSTFKIFTYLAALEAGWKPFSRIADMPVSINGWSPRDYDHRFRGNISLTEALADSRNAATVRLARDIGFGRVAAMAAKFGIPTGKTPSFVLGTTDVSLVDMTAAYASIAAGGRRVRAIGILAVLDPHGALRYRAARPNPKQIVARPYIKQLTDMLHAAAKHALPGEARSLGPIAGKTGTTQHNRDAWFVGFARGQVVGVWFGNDDNTPMNRVAGATLPAHTWWDFMSRSSVGTHRLH